MTEWCKHFYTKVISDPLMRVLTRTSITPNKLTIFNHIITLTFGIYCFSRGSQLWNIAGLGVMLVIGMIDYADGDLAKRTGKYSELGVWLDSVFDVMIQSIVMGAIIIGAMKQDLLPFYGILYYVGNAGQNLVSFHYNHKFGFDSHIGSEHFRAYMDSCHKDIVRRNINRFIKNIIDPTSSYAGLFVFTIRYWIVLGAFFNIMPLIVVITAIIGNIRWLIMYILYALHLKEYKKLWVSQALAILDKERAEHYEV